VNGNVYPAASGSASLQDIPQGTYNYGNAEALSEKQYYSMTDAPDRAHANAARAKAFRKFHIGTGPHGSGEIYDKRIKRNRVGIEFHYDGGSPGTAGCIGYQDPAAKDALIADTDKQVRVKYVGSDAEARALVEQKLGHKVDWSKVKPRRAPGGGGGGGAGAALALEARAAREEGPPDGDGLAEAKADGAPRRAPRGRGEDRGRELDGLRRARDAGRRARRRRDHGRLHAR
jgi:hypothetical protein